MSGVGVIISTKDFLTAKLQPAAFLGSIFAPRSFNQEVSKAVGCSQHLKHSLALLSIVVHYKTLISIFKYISPLCPLFLVPYYPYFWSLRIAQNWTLAIGPFSIAVEILELQSYLAF